MNDCFNFVYPACTKCLYREFTFEAVCLRGDMVLIGHPEPGNNTFLWVNRKEVKILWPDQDSGSREYVQEQP